MKFLAFMLLASLAIPQEYSDLYYSLRQNNRDSKVLVLCGIASFIENNNTLVVQDFQNYYFIGFPEPASEFIGPDERVDKCLTDKVIHNLPAIQYIEDTDLLLEIFLYKHDKRFIRTKAFVDHATRLGNDTSGHLPPTHELSRFNVEYHLSELNCYEQLHYKKFLKLYGVSEPNLTAQLTMLIQWVSRNTTCKSRFLVDEIQKLRHAKSLNAYHLFVNRNVFGDYFGSMFENKSKPRFKANYELFKYDKMSNEFDLDSSFYSKIVMRVYFYGYRAPVIKPNPAKGLELVREYLKSSKDRQADLFANFSRMYERIKHRLPESLTPEDSQMVSYYLLDSSVDDDNFIASFFLFIKYYLMDDPGLRVEDLKTISQDLNSRYKFCLKRVFGDLTPVQRKDEEQRTMVPDCLRMFPPNLELLRNLDMPIDIDEVVKYSNSGEESKLSLTYTVLDYMTQLKNYYQLFVDYKTNMRKQSELRTVAYYAYVGVPEKVIELYDIIRDKGNLYMETFLELKAMLNGSYDLLSIFCEKLLAKKVKFQGEVLDLDDLCKIVLEKEYTNNHNPHALFLLMENYDMDIDNDFKDIKMFVENKFINFTNVWALIYGYVKMKMRNYLKPLLGHLKAYFS